MNEDLRKAGKIAKRALLLSKKLVKPGESILSVALKIEQYILDSGAQLAFPVNISINEIAAHFTPDYNDASVFREGDIVKVDVGAHINGWISDNAITIDLGNHKNLVEASKRALDNVEKMLKDGISIGEIGKVIEETIKSFGLNPIRNLTGHEINQWILHAGITIPNYNNHSIKTLESNKIYAIEPFATNGIGYVKNGSPSGILRVNSVKKPRGIGVRKIFEFILEKYRTLPFARRWLYEYFDKSKVDLAIGILKSQRLLYEYPILIESYNGLVSQFENTYFILENGYILVTDSED